MKTIAIFYMRIYNRYNYYPSMKGWHFMNKTKTVDINNVTFENINSSVEIDDNEITINSESGKLHFLNQ